MNNNSYVKLKLVFEDQKKPYLLDISSLLYDFELLHDLSLLLLVNDYSDFRFSHYFWYRKRRPLKDHHRLRASRIVKESPLAVELILSIVAVSSGAIWAIAQAIEKIGNWRLNRKKLKSEIEKLDLEKRALSHDETRANIEIQNRLMERECLLILESLIRRLEANVFKLQDMRLYSEEIDDNSSREK